METEKPKTEPRKESKFCETPTYDPATRVLTITFKKTQQTYDYPDFAPEDAYAFIESPSWGKAYNERKHLFSKGVKRVPQEAQRSS